LLLADFVHKAVDGLGLLAFYDMTADIVETCPVS
jgi:hypothetical protein